MKQKTGFWKKLAAVAAALALCLPMIPAMHAVKASAAVVGDCDGNDVFDLRDAECMQQYLLCGRTELLGGDLDLSGSINAADLTLLKRKFKMTPKPETVTLMVYISGANLESSYGEVSADLEEITAAQYSENLQVVAMTGGASAWHNELADADANYRITVSAEGARSEKMDGENRDMASGDTLREFITDTAAAYPADRYALIIWGHGAGPLYGLCYDELSGKTMFLPQLRDALEGADVHFDWIGFDCCIMGSLETAYAVKDSADYMIACPAVMSSLGWAYEPFITKWAADPACPTEELLACIADTSIDANVGSGNSAAMASVDLQYTEALTDAVYTYINDLYAAYKDAGISDIYEARGKMLDSEAEGFSTYDTVDLVSLVTLLPAEGHSDAVTELVAQAVTHRALLEAGDFCGLTLWFPEKFPTDGLSLMPSVYKDLGLSETYIAQMRELSSAIRAEMQDAA
ncbi:MAG: hypothetical protein IJ060_04050 [Oscillospiraceae bacterium]|nr:hypothetical protein [Oscillospiraceae bacterium]